MDRFQHGSRASILVIPFIVSKNNAAMRDKRDHTVGAIADATRRQRTGGLRSLHGIFEAMPQTAGDHAEPKPLFNATVAVGGDWTP